MKLPILNLDSFDRIDQFAKVEEEFNEFKLEHLNENKNNRIAEAFDLTQAILGYLLITHTLEEIQGYAERHCQKLIDRGWDTDGHIELKFHYK